MTQLFELPKGVKIRVLEPVRTPIGGKPIHKGDILQFDHVDGMYSYCIDADGDVVHPAAWTEAEVVQ
jgi:hypothetical protein